MFEHILSKHCSSAQKRLPHLLAVCLICCLAACNFRKKKMEEDQATGNCESFENKMLRMVVDVGESERQRRGCILSGLSLLKAFRCSASLSGSSRARLELLFLFLAADERTESDPDSWDYIGIWITDYCHPNMCHPLRLSTWKHNILYESNTGKTGGFP